MMTSSGFVYICEECGEYREKWEIEQLDNVFVCLCGGTRFHQQSLAYQLSQIRERLDRLEAPDAGHKC